MNAKRLSNIISIYQYGSTVYGVDRPGSDVDLIVVVDSKNDVTIPARARQKAIQLGTHHKIKKAPKIDVNIYTEEEFVRALNSMEISFLECVFDYDAISPLIYGKKHEVEIDVCALRDSISKKASNSWVKAKKKFIVEEDYNPEIATKSAWHSLRILIFGAQIAKHGKITNIQAANEIFPHILACASWQEIQEKYKLLFNSLASDFRKVAPKCDKC